MNNFKNVLYLLTFVVVFSYISTPYLINNNQQVAISNETSYKVVKELGPDHAKEFEVTVVINSKVKGQGLGKNKKGAEQAAAKMAMESFLSISKPYE